MALALVFFCLLSGIIYYHYVKTSGGIEEAKDYFKKFETEGCFDDA